MIRLVQVSKKFQNQQGNVTALENINLSTERGEFVTIVGPSGSGKSTLLSILGLLSKPTSGLLEVDGQDTRRFSERQTTHFRAKKFGFVFQFPSLVNTLDTRENVLLPKLLFGKVSKADWERADWLLEQVGLQTKVHSRSFELSGGEQRRVALARALINDPDILLADEPTGALDQETALVIMELFLTFHRRGKTILLVTHDPLITRYGERTIRIHTGRIVDEQNTNRQHGITSTPD